MEAVKVDKVLVPLVKAVSVPADPVLLAKVAPVVKAAKGNVPQARVRPVKVGPAPSVKELLVLQVREALVPPVREVNVPVAPVDNNVQQVPAVSAPPAEVVVEDLILVPERVREVPKEDVVLSINARKMMRRRMKRKAPLSSKALFPPFSPEPCSACVLIITDTKS